MNADRFVASVKTRLASLATTLLFATAVTTYWLGIFEGAERAILIAAVIIGILAFVGFIHSFRPVYSLWMRFTKALHALVVILLFSACYLCVVPIFFLITWPFDPLKLRKRREADTFWITRRSTQLNLDSLRRLG